MRRSTPRTSEVCKNAAAPLLPSGAENSPRAAAASPEEVPAPPANAFRTATKSRLEIVTWASCDTAPARGGQAAFYIRRPADTAVQVRSEGPTPWVLAVQQLGERRKAMKRRRLCGPAAHSS